MPANLPREWFLIEEKFREEKDIRRKIELLKQLIAITPKHKGTENLLANLRKRLAKLRKESKKKKGGKRKEFSIEKRGAAQICVIGLTNSGKSSLLKALSGKEIEISDLPFTTKKPEIRMVNYKDVQLQFIEIPSTFDSYLFGILNNCDLILALLDSTEDVNYQKGFIESILNPKLLSKTIFVVNKIDKRNVDCNFLKISALSSFNLDKLLEVIWKKLNLIRVYAKPPGKKPEKIPVTLPASSTIKDFAEKLRISIDRIKFARVFDSTKFSGRRVGLDYKLKDGMVVELHLRC